MRTIIHDLKDISHLKLNSDDILVGEVKNNCIGCFSCWVKHPLNCIFNDKIKNNGKNVLDSDELIIISKCVNGSYSSKVKRILERSISYVLPFFTVRNKTAFAKWGTIFSAVPPCISFSFHFCEMLSLPNVSKESSISFPTTVFP